MAAKNGPPRLRRLMGRARGRGEPAGQSADAADGWPGSHFGPDPDYGLYAEYADPLAESERQFMTEAREIMGIDQEPRGSRDRP
jgi:hypothetical protein